MRIGQSSVFRGVPVPPGVQIATGETEPDVYGFVIGGEWTVGVVRLRRSRRVKNFNGEHDAFADKIDQSGWVVRRRYGLKQRRKSKKRKRKRDIKEGEREREREKEM